MFHQQKKVVIQIHSDPKDEKSYGTFSGKKEEKHSYLPHTNIPAARHHAVQITPEIEITRKNKMYKKI